MHFDLKSFCGNANETIWDTSSDNFGICFQKFAFGGGTFAILGITSAFYVGKKFPPVLRTKKQDILIILRFITCVLSLLLAILNPCLLVYLSETKLYWVDIFSSSIQIATWIIHLAYLAVLKNNLSSSSRGPKSVIISWAITLTFHVFYCKEVWTDLSIVYSMAGSDYRVTVHLLRSLLTTGLVLQVLYLFTILPEGRAELVDSQEFSERTPLLRGRLNQTNYTRLQETIDPQYLGVAEDRCNRLSYLTFYWANKLLKKGSLECLETVDDLYELPPSLQTEVVSQQVQNTLMLSRPLTSDESEVLRPMKYSLLKALHKCFGLSFYSIGFLKLVGDTLAFAGPLLLNELILFVEKKENYHWKGYAAGIGICFTTLLGGICTVHYNYFLAKINIQIRAAVITSIFRKIQNLNAATMAQFSTGEIVTFMNTDVDRVTNFCGSFHSFWSLPLQLGLTLYLLYRQIGVAFLSGLLFAILLIPINRFLAIKIGQLSKRMMHFKDRRVNLMSEALELIKAIKLNSWESIFKRKIIDERFGELKALEGRKYLDAACVFFWATTPVLIPIAAFGTFVAIGNEMEPAKVFTAVALFNMLIVPLNAFPWVINGLVEAWVSIKRIDKIMQAQDSSINYYYTMVPEMSQKGSNLQIVIINGRFSWSSQDNKASGRSDDKEGHSSQEQHIVESSHEESPLVFEISRERTSTRNSDDQLNSPEGATALSPSLKFPKRRRHPASSSSISSIHSESMMTNDVPLVLSGINIHIKKNQFIGVVGNVGSGKTALLNAIAGELHKIGGVIAASDLHQGFGLATQDPWLQNLTIKENIIFGQHFDPVRYRSVLHACALEQDLQVLAKGENAKCGENGTLLSGGQRARVALARTVYQNKNVYLLDDVLSAVDYAVAKHILKRLIHGLLVGKTIILVTNHVHLLAKAHLVIHLENGSVLRQGRPKEILERMGVNIYEEESEEKAQRSTGTIPRQKLLADNPKMKFNGPECSPADTEEEEGRAYGGLSNSVYVTYLSAIGGLLSLAVFFSIILMQTARNLTDTWLAKWVTSTSPPINSTIYEDFLWVPLSQTSPFISEFSGIYPDVVRQLFNFGSNKRLISSAFKLQEMDATTKFYLSVYGLLAALHALFTFARAFLFAYAGICAAKRLHRKLLDSVLNAKMSFFDLNPAGRILNRFSSDIYASDDSLPFKANILFAQIFGLFGSLIITVYGIPWIILLFIPLIFVYYNVQDYYRHTSRELRRIYSLSLSPLYNHFVETISGLTVIRSHRAGHRFSELGNAYLEQNQRAQFCIQIVSQWLNWRLQLIGAGILGGVVFLALWEHSVSGVNAGLVGLVISYALSINGNLNGVVTSLTETERELISVERLDQYISGAEREGEGEYTNPLLALPHGWPSNASIKMQNVYLKYHPHNPYSLRNVTLEIGSCEKVGIVGRTGAGKTSLFMALFRLVGLTRGRIFIDGVDITDLSIKRLRSNLSIISQDVLLFSGTVRENLDPKGQNSDDSILRVIQQCHLTGIVDELGGLDGILEVGGRNLSAGQRQLFCLARALLGRTKIVCVDEGTSSLDYEMDLKIQNVMRDAFRNKTVLIIAHRIHTVRDCDKVIVMEEGEVIEMGRPSELLEDPNSTFRSIFRG